MGFHQDYRWPSGLEMTWVGAAEGAINYGIGILLGKAAYREESSMQCRRQIQRWGDLQYQAKGSKTDQKLIGARFIVMTGGINHGGAICESRRNEARRRNGIGLNCTEAHSAYCRKGSAEVRDCPGGK
jgi:hypothetical protein